MNRKVHNLLLLCLLLLPMLSVAQEDFSIFAKQKVVVADVIDRNDRPLSDGIKRVIHQSIVDVCTNSEEYEVFEVNIAEIKSQLTANNQKADFANICKKIGSKADFIIFPSVKTSRSAIGETQDINIFISATLYRIDTATEVLSNQATAGANSQSIIKVSSEMITQMLGLSGATNGNTQQITTSTNTTRVESSEELFQKGKKYYDDGYYNSAVLHLRKAAEQGHAGGQTWLGICYSEGKGVTQDDTEAIRWLRKAAEQGNAEGQYHLGQCYVWGKGVTSDSTEAIRWTRKAAEQGNAEAQVDLGVRYYRGSGVTQDETEAVRWYRKAAEQGHAEGQYLLGQCYELGLGITRDGTEAVRWYRKAAEQGLAEGQYNLGICYYKSIGVNEDDYEAIRWFRKAAEQGYIEGQWMLGLFYENGFGVTKNINEAVKWYRKAAEHEHSLAKSRLKALGYSL